MKTRTRITSIVLAAACVSGVGIATAAPAQAATTWGYSVGRASQDECDYALRNAYREKIMDRYQVSNFHPCEDNGSGYWNGSFYYGD